MGAYTAAFRAVVHFDLDHCSGGLLLGTQPDPPGIQGIDDEVAGFKGATERDRQLAAVFVDNPTGVVFSLVAKIVIAGLVVAPRQPPAGEFPQRHRRFAVHAQRLTLPASSAWWSFF